jgi:transposase
VKAREDVRGKLLAQEQELYVFAESRARIAKERSMRRRQLKWLWRRLKELSAMQRLTREALLMKLGAAQNKAPAAWRLVTVEMAIQGASFGYWLSRKKLREVRRREGLLPARDARTSAEAFGPGTATRSVLEKFCAVQMIDVHVPITDGRELMLTRYTQPELKLLLEKLRIALPPQSPPKITAAQAASATPVYGGHP